MVKPINWNREYESQSSLLWETEAPENIIIKVLKEKNRLCILDAGCGKGTDLIYMKQKKHLAIGIDISYQGLLKAQKEITLKKLRIPLAQGNVLSLPFRDRTFDFINDRGCFHHVSPEEREIYAQEACRVLKPGGQLLLRCFSEEYFKKGGAGYTLVRDHIRDSFSRGFTLGEIRDYQSLVDSFPVDMSWCLMKKV